MTNPTPSVVARRRRLAVAALAACGLTLGLAAAPSHAATGSAGRPAVTAKAPAKPKLNVRATVRAAGDERTPATLALGCRVDGGGVRCTWTGDTPAGAVRELVLRSDGRVRLDTTDVSVRTYLDGQLPSSASFSYVVVFLDASGRTLAHSNPSVVTRSATARR